MTPLTTDALSRLVQRTLRPERTLQPYVPSLFEASPDLAEPDPTEVEVSGSATTASAKGGEVGEQIVEGVPPATREPGPVTPADRPVARPAVAADDRPPDPRTVDVPVAAMEPPGEPAPPSEHVAAVERVIERVVATAIARPPDTPARPEGSTDKPPAPASTSPALPAVLRPAELPPEPVPEPPPEPTISITIGRVEVRATSAPPKTPEAARRERRIMSLDDYLERRARGSTE